MPTTTRSRRMASLARCGTRWQMQFAASTRMTDAICVSRTPSTYAHTCWCLTLRLIARLCQSYDGDDLGVSGAVDDYVGDEVTTKAMAEGAIEGVAADYAMAGPFATAFKFSRFDATSAKPRDVSKLSGQKAKSSGAKAAGAVADAVDEPVMNSLT